MANHEQQQQPQFSWRPGVRFNLDPNVVGRELARLQREKGELTAEVVVEAARDPRSPLHDAFDWDPQRAAHEHWLHIGRRLIKSVAIRYEKRERVEYRPLYHVVPNRNPSLPGVYKQGWQITDAGERARALRQAQVQMAGAAASLVALEDSILGDRDVPDDRRQQVAEVRGKVADASQAVADLSLD